jgi:hypothetical protein
MLSRSLLITVVGFCVSVHAVSFPYENITLTDADVKNNPSIAFGSLSSPSAGPTSLNGCKIFPGDKQWPSDSAWAYLNSTLGGTLIKGVPPALVCYTGTYDAAQCAEVTSQYLTNQTWRSEDPVMVENEWLDGDSCPAQEYNNVPGGTTTSPTCNVVAYPAYVVNVTTVKGKSYFLSIPEYSIICSLAQRWRNTLYGVEVTLQQHLSFNSLTRLQTFSWQ